MLVERASQCAACTFAGSARYPVHIPSLVHRFRGQLPRMPAATKSGLFCEPYISAIVRGFAQPQDEAIAPSLCNSQLATRNSQLPMRPCQVVRGVVSSARKYKASRIDIFADGQRWGRANEVSSWKVTLMFPVAPHLVRSPQRLTLQSSDLVHARWLPLSETGERPIWSLQYYAVVGRRENAPLV